MANMLILTLLAVGASARRLLPVARAPIAVHRPPVAAAAHAASVAVGPATAAAAATVPTAARPVPPSTATLLHDAAANGAMPALSEWLKTKEDADSSDSIVAMRPQGNQRVGFGATAALASSSRSATTALASAGDSEVDALDAAAQRGVELAIEKGLLPDSVEVEPVTDLSELDAEAAANKILETLGDEVSKGSIILLQGPASEKKDAVMKALGRQLSKSERWPMELFFRAMTFMLSTVSDSSGKSYEDFMKERPEMLAAGIEMIQEMAPKGVGAMVGDAEQMLAMVGDSASMADKIPASIEFGTGEVVGFVNDALKQQEGSNSNVLLIGSEPIVKYIRTPYRFNI